MKPATRQWLRRWARGPGLGVADRVTRTDESLTRTGMPASFRVRGVDWRLVAGDGTGLAYYEAAGLPRVYCDRTWPGRFLGRPDPLEAGHWEVAVGSGRLQPVPVTETLDRALAFRVAKELATELVETGA